jgi:putative phage-type endonuclease
MATELITHSRQDWLEQRRTVIGGSDAAAALGLSKWRTQYDLYLEKIGESVTVETEPMYWGTQQEPLIRQRYSNDTGLQVIKPGFLVHPTLKFMGGNVDGLVGSDRILEVKTSRTSEGWGEPETDEIPDDYLLQTQHYLLVTGRQIADVAVLIGGSDYRVYRVEADPELHEMIIDGERAFWEMVESRNPPPVTTLPDIKRRFPKSSALAVVASNSVLHAAQQLHDLNNLADRVGERQDDLKAIIQLHLGEGDTLKDESGNVLATWKSDRDGKKFNVKKFEQDHPELAALYYEKTKGSRKFLLKDVPTQGTTNDVNRISSTTISNVAVEQ